MSDDEYADEPGFPHVDPAHRDYPRTKEERPIGAIAQSHLRLVAATAEARDHESWTEEQWAARDAEVQARARVEQANQRAAERKSFRERLVAADFPIRALDAAEEPNLDAPAIIAVRDWKPSERSILVLSGIVGCGKTVAACWWALQLFSVPRFIRANTFAATSRYKRNGVDGRAEMLAAPAAVLDDLGAEYIDEKGSFRTDLDELVDVFYGNRKPLVITTNLEWNDTEEPKTKIRRAGFKSRYGSRLADRMRECSRWISTNAPSMRGRK